MGQFDSILVRNGQLEEKYIVFLGLLEILIFFFKQFIKKNKIAIVLVENNYFFLYIENHYLQILDILKQK